MSNVPSGAARWLFVAAVGAVGASGALACGDAPPAKAPVRTLPAYSGVATHLFDDGIEARALGFALEQRDPMAEGVLRERLHRADAVLRVRVTTFTSNQEESSRSYQIGFKTLAKLQGGNPPPEEFVVIAGKASPSLGLLKNFEAGLVGTSFVAFVSSFARGDGETELHFHLAPDNADELAAIKSASVLSEFKTEGAK